MASSVTPVGVVLLVVAAGCAASVADAPVAEPVSADVSLASDIEAYQEWTMYFYRSPDPDRVPEALRATEYWNQGMNGDVRVTIGTIAFFAEVFGRYPERVDAWVASATTPMEPRHLWVLQAVHMSGAPDADATIRAAMESASPDVRSELEALLHRQPYRPLRDPPTTTSEVRQTLSRYMASGDPRFVEPLITMLLDPVGDDAPPEARQAYLEAKSLLRINALYHESIMAMIEQAVAGAGSAAPEDLVKMFPHLERINSH